MPPRGVVLTMMLLRGELANLNNQIIIEEKTRIKGGIRVCNFEKIDFFFVLSYS